MSNEALARAIYDAISEEAGSVIPWEEADPYAKDRFRRPALKAATVYLQEREVVVIEQQSVRTLRDAVSALYLDAERMTAAGPWLVTSDQINAVVSAASAIVPPGVWEDGTAPFPLDSQETTS